MKVETIKAKVLSGEEITREEALFLTKADFAAVTSGAQEIRQHFCGDAFDLCAIINGKSGRCGEDCKYCAQSCHYHTEVEEYPLLSSDRILAEALHCEEQEVLRFSVVTSGRGLLDGEVKDLEEIYARLKANSGISLCASHGILSQEQLEALKRVGVLRYHHNLETSRRFFPKICSTHTYDDRIATIKAAQKAGLSLCSGGIMGLGETMEDRVDLFFELKKLGITSVPINILNPIQGTPLGEERPLASREVSRILAVARFILPKAALRLGGGRGLLPDHGEEAFGSGANAVITGDMLTTHGFTIETDKALLKKCGFEVKTI